jgi:abortive infection bacteriophage resistance protein
MNGSRVPCPKKWHSVEAQLAKLQSRGLQVANIAEAATFLRHLNYYCFTGYGLAFEQRRDCYLPGTTFDQIRKTYEFDRALRDLFTESIELVELDLRTAIAHSFGQGHGAFGHTIPGNFHDAVRHQEWLDKLRTETERSSDLFIKHHKATYQEFPDVPVWVVVEITSFGSLSTFYRTMLKADQKPIASRYGVQPHVLGSWIHHLVYVRNLCAHHARLWDKIWSIKPDLPAGNVWSAPILSSNTQVFASLLIQAKLLATIGPEKTFISNWRRRVETLITQQLPGCPNPLAKMGLQGDWANHPVWQAL